MTIVFALGLKPVALLKVGAILDGLLLTPLQALWVFAGIFIVQKRLFSPEVSKILKPHWIFGADAPPGIRSLCLFLHLAYTRILVSKLSSLVDHFNIFESAEKCKFFCDIPVTCLPVQSACPVFP